MNTEKRGVNPDGSKTNTGLFRKVDAVVWTRTSDMWDGYLILPLRATYQVLSEDDGFWSYEDSFDTKRQAMEFIAELNARNSASL